MKPKQCNAHARNIFNVFRLKRIRYTAGYVRFHDILHLTVSVTRALWNKLNVPLNSG